MDAHCRLPRFAQCDLHQAPEGRARGLGRVPGTGGPRRRLQHGDKRAHREARAGMGLRQARGRLRTQLGRRGTTGTFLSNPVKEDEPACFSEPGIFLTRPNGILQALWVQSSPQIRPEAEQNAESDPILPGERRTAARRTPDGSRDADPLDQCFRRSVGTCAARDHYAEVKPAGATVLGSSHRNMSGRAMVAASVSTGRNSGTTRVAPARWSTRPSRRCAKAPAHRPNT